MTIILPTGFVWLPESVEIVAKQQSQDRWAATELTGEEAEATAKRDAALKMIDSAVPDPLTSEGNDYLSDIKFGDFGSLNSQSKLFEQTAPPRYSELPPEVWSNSLENGITASARKKLDKQEGLKEEAWGVVRQALVDGRIVGHCARAAAIDLEVPPLMWGKEMNGYCHRRGRVIVVDTGPPVISGLPYIAAASLHALLHGEVAGAETEAEKQQAASRTPARRPASDAAIKKAIVACKKLADERGLAALSRTELVSIIQHVYGGTSREKIRRVFGDSEIIPLLPHRSGPQGARNPNRNNELDEFSDFLSAAKLQN
ncbi:hypothetical protein [Manganibacter manganicus]|uniref:Uncharacterized protein n=1 Tax=Manganibacter manganicus TaxID=1873176 RepID=A0A1V8RTG8_9HYPH|nr:hypothetical protein [Pseudaminobacter manganicus]OQM76465.1 hypothetical protein BFN67_13845 [Pseudaminobacter manganicus]